MRDDKTKEKLIKELEALLKDESGKAKNLLLTILNVTEQKKGELAIKQREEESFRNYQSQMAINDMLRISLEDIPLSLW